jgi:hypothetical protein
MPVPYAGGTFIVIRLRLARFDNLFAMVDIHHEQAQ